MGNHFTSRQANVLPRLNERSPKLAPISTSRIWSAMGGGTRGKGLASLIASSLENTQNVKLQLMLGAQGPLSGISPASGVRQRRQTDAEFAGRGISFLAISMMIPPSSGTAPLTRWRLIDHFPP